MQGYDVVLVHEASEAIAAMKGNSHPDLVLLSYRLPGLTGLQVNSNYSNALSALCHKYLLPIYMSTVLTSGGAGNQTEPR